MNGLDVDKWETFALGQLGASAALLGLVFVGISINLRDVVSSRRLVNRACEAVVLLATILVTSSILLVPGQGRRTVGVELGVAAVAVLVAVGFLQRSLGTDSEGAPPGDANEPGLSHLVRRLFGLGAPLLMVAAAGCLLAESGGGLYFWSGGVLLAYVGALTSAWVLLVEILR